MEILKNHENLLQEIHEKKPETLKNITPEIAEQIGFISSKELPSALMIEYLNRYKDNALNTINQKTQ